MTRTLTKLGSTLDEAAYEWLVDEWPALAASLETEVLAGATPDEVRRFMTAHVGEHRVALIARCVSAARHLMSGQAQRA
jgi:hypothetical protein